MAGFNWGPAVGGLAGGLSSGIQSGEQLQQYLLQQQGQKALANMLMGQGQTPQLPGGSPMPTPLPPQTASPSTPSGLPLQPSGTATPSAAPTAGGSAPAQPYAPPQQGASMPAASPYGGLAPMGGSAFTPNLGSASAMQGRSAQIPTTGFQPNAPQPRPAPGPVAQPSAFGNANVQDPMQIAEAQRRAQQGQGGQPQGQGGLPGVPEQYQQGIQTIRSVAQSIKAANPQASPQVIMAATMLAMQQLNPLVKQDAPSEVREARKPDNSEATAGIPVSADRRKAGRC